MDDVNNKYLKGTDHQSIIVLVGIYIDFTSISSLFIRLSVNCWIDPKIFRM